MPKTPDQEILDYLCRPETIPQVLTIVQNAPAIRSRLWQGFWTDLVKHLETNAPTGLRELANAPRHSMRWVLCPALERLEEYNAGAYYLLDGKVQSKSECLSYSVFQQKGKIYYGVGWNDPPTDSPVLQSPDVKKLSDFLSGLDFGSERGWFGWNDVDCQNSGDAFLLEYYEGKEQILNQISDPVWKMMQETFEMVVNANRVLTKAKG